MAKARGSAWSELRMAMVAILLRCLLPLIPTDREDGLLLVQYIHNWAAGEVQRDLLS